jgi:hypothetical protein
MYQKTLLLSISLFCSIIAISQKAPMTFGKVDKADLEMKFYPADSSAIAVVLCNYGYYDFIEFKFVHQMRIKILKEEGKVRGDFFVPAAEKTVVRGQTVNIENGVPVITKLKKESIFIERIIKDVYRARVAMPNVKVGSVLDVEFFYEGFPNIWTFEETIPVRWSEYRETNSYLRFKRNFVGYTPLAIATATRWVAKDVPAFKTEPYVNNLNNFLSHFDINLLSIDLTGFIGRASISWDEIATNLRTAKDFGMQFRDFNFFLNSTVKEIKGVAKTPEDKLIFAFEAVKKIKWNQVETFWASDTGLDQAFSKKIGSAADINMILIILLRKLDIDANPVIMSTRNNGFIPTYSASLNKVNYLIAHVLLNDKTYLLDATEEYLQAGILPERALNGRGFLIKDNSHEWIELTPQKKEKNVQLLDLKLNTDGVMKGSWTKTSYDYAALNQRINYKSFNNQDDYLKSIESKNIGLSIENYTFTNFDSLQQPIKEEFSIELKNRALKTNNQMFVSPVIFEKFLENPFKAEQRLYPIDFLTPKENMQMLRLELPIGYQVEQLPKNIKMTMPENVANFQMQSSVNGNIVQILFKLNINKPIFYQPEYLDLKSFFDELVKKQSEMLVIKKI